MKALDLFAGPYSKPDPVWNAIRRGQPVVYSEDELRSWIAERAA